MNVEDLWNRSIEQLALRLGSRDRQEFRRVA